MRVSLGRRFSIQVSTSNPPADLPTSAPGKVLADTVRDQDSLKDEATCWLLSTFRDCDFRFEGIRAGF